MREVALAAEEEHGLLTRRLPVRQVRSLQIDSRAGCRSGCNGADEATVFLEPKDAGDSEVIVQLLEVHVAIKCSVCMQISSASGFDTVRDGNFPHAELVLRALMPASPCMSLMCRRMFPSC